MDKIANLLATRQTILTCQDVTIKTATSWEQVVVMEFGKRHNTQQTFNRANLLRTCCRLAMGKLWGNWCNGFSENLLRGSS